MTVATLLTPAAILRRAADGLTTGEIRWGRDDFIGADGCRCALGAITLAASPSDRDGDPRFAGPQAVMAARTLADFLVEEFGAARCVAEHDVDWIEIVGGWNDAPGRQVADVINALEFAAARLDQDGYAPTAVTA